MKFIIIIFPLLFTLNKYSGPCENPSFKELEALLGHNINTVPKYNCIKEVDTTMEDDEGEDLKWKGKAYYYQSKLVFIVESNWVDKNKVNSITIYSNKIKEGDLYVGQELKAIIGLVSSKIRPEPDGYLFLTYKKDNKIAVQLDVSKLPENSVVFRIDNISELPGNLKVESIVIQ